MSKYSHEDQTKIYSQLIGRVWADREYEELLKSNPRAALAQMGLEFPADREIVVKQNDSQNVYFALDAQPVSAAARLEVEQAAEFSCFGTVGTLGTAGTACGTLGSAASFGTVGCYDI
ncbi:MAG: hypothetical protein AAGN35_02720 [Bacteroidota bacterium]